MCDLRNSNNLLLLILKAVVVSGVDGEKNETEIALQ